MSEDVLWRRLRYFLSPQLDIYRYLAPKLQGRAVLEVGFGTGAGTLQLAPFTKNITAIEVDSEAVDFACFAYPMQADWQRSSILDYRPGEKYDAVVMIEVLEHIKDYKRALQNIKDCLHPGGVLYMSARNANASLRKNELHEREWRAGEFRAALYEYFRDVTLWDYTLTQEQGDETQLTPLLGKAVK